MYLVLNVCFVIRNFSQNSLWIEVYLMFPRMYKEHINKIKFHAQTLCSI